ncbi:uncharacterized protein LOC126867339 [Bombus huntii]|uniref:uncharacterized protein LOC126867339 n=1 Tax=Bombus huntii TaxID=85661 RepID=UPI0021AAE014|nr:uncharacterized protein LOC126867339 [Bombus huntii]
MHQDTTCCYNRSRRKLQTIKASQKRREVSKMKAIAALLVVLVAASPLNAFKVPATGSGELARDFQQFVDITPNDEILAVSKAYLAQDKQFQIAIKLVRSSESKQWVQDVEKAPEFKMLLDFIQERGFDIKLVTNNFNKALGIPPLDSRIQAYSTPYRNITGGIQGYIYDIGRLISMDKFAQIYEDRIANSKAFRDFVHEVISAKYVPFYLSIFSNKHFQNLEKQAENSGIDRNYFLVLAPSLLITSTVI